MVSQYAWLPHKGWYIGAIILLWCQSKNLAPSHPYFAVKVHTALQGNFLSTLLRPFNCTVPANRPEGFHRLAGTTMVCFTAPILQCLSIILRPFNYYGTLQQNWKESQISRNHYGMLHCSYWVCNPDDRVCTDLVTRKVFLKCWLPFDHLSYVVMASKSTQEPNLHDGVIAFPFVFVIKNNMIQWCSLGREISSNFHLD